MVKVIISIKIWALFSSCIQPSSSSRILAVETEVKVTVFTPFTDGNRKNYTKVDTTLGKVMRFMDMDLNQMKISMITKIDNFVAMSRMQCYQVYKNSKMKEILNSKRTDFDLLIIKFFASNCVSYIATVLN